jgi:hypothetical protein
MINLIPNEEKKQMARGFYLRLLVVWFLVLALAFFVATISLLPSYLVSSAKREIAFNNLNVQKNIVLPVIDQNTLTTINDLNTKISLIEKVNKDKFVVSEKVLNEIILRKIPEIKIIQISYEKGDSAEKKVKIHGQASSREKLLAFRQLLEQDPFFTNVNLPISSFIKGSDIVFDLSLTVL